MNSIRRQNKETICAINIVPYIDVMLVLLIIFMITAPLFNQGTIDIPSIGDTEINPKKSGSVELFIDANGDIDLVNHDTGKNYQQLQREQLRSLVEQEILLRPDAPFIIAADKKTFHEDVVSLIDVLRSAGVEQIGIEVNIHSQ